MSTAWLLYVAKPFTSSKRKYNHSFPSTETTSNLSKMSGITRSPADHIDKFTTLSEESEM